MNTWPIFLIPQAHILKKDGFKHTHMVEEIFKTNTTEELCYIFKKDVQNPAYCIFDEPSTLQKLWTNQV